ncbi:MAG: hypothetical protein HC932_02210 [Thermales bacterium]|nr:hypothetical protein [Thermales bacterium]
MKVVREQLLIILVGMISLGFTIFILINSYEVFSNKDIPYISSLRLMEAQEVIDRVIQITDENSLLKEFETDTPSMGELDYMYFPSTDDRIFIGKERYNNGWLQRPNNIHYHILNYDEKGLAGDYLFIRLKIGEPYLLRKRLKLETKYKLLTSMEGAGVL